MAQLCVMTQLLRKIVNYGKLDWCCHQQAEVTLNFHQDCPNKVIGGNFLGQWGMAQLKVKWLHGTKSQASLSQNGYLPWIWRQSLNGRKIFTLAELYKIYLTGSQILTENYCGGNDFGLTVHQIIESIKKNFLTNRKVVRISNCRLWPRHSPSPT